MDPLNINVVNVICSLWKEALAQNVSTVIANLWVTSHFALCVKCLPARTSGEFDNIFNLKGPCLIKALTILKKVSPNLKKFKALKKLSTNLKKQKAEHKSLKIFKATKIFI